ncbi:putative peroxisomal membrane protein 2, pxmp2 [Ixodes scapularis]|uniref:Mitochondrial inner membrane protein Mpv17 n=1 Tax=Ixodes scapularis TaxID=6945 RepID=B7Q0I9_IXOSC|nr:peroxisomal membrane protein 2, pxmp2, putative [Ixodes scapularis]|eukprot:XP_002407867.1 peroxisomal membrane protein 2, pxmp2, putative [Ixodes scapularis]
MMRIASFYDDLLQTNPTGTRIASIAILSLVADLLSQAVTRGASVSIDVRQAAGSFVTGLVFTGPVQVLSFVLLDRLVGDGGLTATIAKVLLNQLFIIPLIILGYIAVNGALKGLPWAAIQHIIRTKYVSILKTRLVFWPAAQGLIYQFVPKDYRPLAMSVIALFWSTYVSWKANGPAAPSQLSTKGSVQKQRTQ